MHINRAFLFPGQGSQIVGMGKDFFDHFEVAKHTFQNIDEVLNYNLSNIIFNGPIEDLTLTANTQPALMAVSVAIFNTIIKQTGKKIHELSSFALGHSLGEYSALCASGAISLDSTTKLLHVRGTSMQKACPEGEGAMAACIGISFKELQQLHTHFNNQGVCEIANDNIEGQIVISGHTKNIDHMIAVLKDTGHKAIKLKVSAPFHSSLMKYARDCMIEAFNEVNITPPMVPIISNVTAKQTTSPEEIKTNLIAQICGTVRWRESINELAHLGITELVEIGSGSVLTGMIRKTNHNFNVLNISNIAEMESFLKIIS